MRRLRPGSGTSRIFAPGCQWPAMALSRSLGASIAGTCGVSSEPEDVDGGSFSWWFSYVFFDFR